jgi:Prephenate dehydratase
MNSPDTALQRKSGTSFAFQGAPGCADHVAAVSFLRARGAAMGLMQPRDVTAQLPDEKKPAVRFSPSQTFEDVFRKVFTGETGFGVVPLENSALGPFTGTYELLLKNEVSLLADVYIPIEHHLLGVPGATVDDIKTVVSHAVALRQCKKFLDNHPEMTPKPYWDTSGAAFLVKDRNDKSMAAIAGDSAVIATELEVIQANIADYEPNQTRFGIISPIQYAMNFINLNFPAKPILSFAVELHNENVDFTTLFMTALAPFQPEVGKIIALPIPERPWHNRYIFDLKLKSTAQTQAVWSAIRETAKKARILGIYESLVVEA